MLIVVIYAPRNLKSKFKCILSYIFQIEKLLLLGSIV